MGSTVSDLVDSTFALSIVEIAAFLCICFACIYKFVKLRTTKFVKSILSLMLITAVIQILLGGTGIALWFIYQSNSGNI